MTTLPQNKIKPLALTQNLLTKNLLTKFELIKIRKFKFNETLISHKQKEIKTFAQPLQAFIFLINCKFVL